MRAYPGLWMSPHLYFGVVVVALFFYGSLALGAEIRVPDDYTAIQSACDAANDSDTIKVCKGSYSENISLSDSKEIILSGGWNTSFTAVVGPTAVKGFMSLDDGKTIIDNIYLVDQTYLNYLLSDTGMTQCYNDTNQMLACPSSGQPFFGQDSQYDGPPPSFQDNGNGTITDFNTELIWQQGDSHNDAGGRTWQQATDYCTSLSLGQSDEWRLPNRRELFSIINLGLEDPALDPLFESRSLHYWSETTLAHQAIYAWCVAFYGGHVTDCHKTTGLLYVRCVRGESPVATYVNNGNGTVTDTVTNLVWQQGDSHNDAGGRSWQAALAYCESLDLANQTDWRLPNLRELESLVDPNHYDPALDPLFNCRSSYYWSGSTNVYRNFDAWTIFFLAGEAGEYYKDNAYYVRCVRGGP